MWQKNPPLSGGRCVGEGWGRGGACREYSKRVCPGPDWLRLGFACYGEGVIEDGVGILADCF